VMKKTNIGNTSLHLAISMSPVALETVELLLSVFGNNEKEELIEFVMEKNEEEETALNLAAASTVQRSEEITTLLSTKVTNAKNEIILSPLRQITNTS